MRKWSGLVVPLLVLGLAGCASKPLPVGYSVTTPRQVEQEGAVGALYRGTFANVPSDYQISGRSFDSNGKLGLCALLRVMAPQDVSEDLRKAIAAESSVIVLGRKGDDVTLIIPARFAEVRYIQGKSGDISTIARAGFADKEPGPCVLLDQPWDERWSGHQLTIGIRLSREPRKRSQTVVGGAQ